jgi:hypothetical protein
VVDRAENSQAVRDEKRASIDLRDAVNEHAPAEVIADLDAVHAAAYARVVSLRGRAG